MNRFIHRHAGTFQLIVVVAVVGSALLLSASLQPDSAGIAPSKNSKDLVVSTFVPVATPFRPSIRLNGVVEARTVNQVIPQVSGRVIEVSLAFRPGASVGKGELLFVIDPVDYELAIEQTLAEIAVARSDLAQLEAEAAAEREVWRGKFPNRPIPDLIARVPQIAAAKARVQSAQAARRTAELALSRTTVRAPFDARILETRLNVGQVVGGNTAVGTIFSIDSLEVVASVTAAQRQLIGPVRNQNASIFLPTSRQNAIPGRLARAAATLDQRTRLGALYVTVDQPELLTVGEFVSVEFAGQDLPDSYRVPAASLTSGDRLWVVENGRLAGRTVEVLGREAEMAVVQIFDSADGVVTVPPSNGRDDLPVIISDRTTRTAAGSDSGLTAK